MNLRHLLFLRSREREVWLGHDSGPTKKGAHPTDGRPSLCCDGRFFDESPIIDGSRHGLPHLDERFGAAVEVVQVGLPQADGVEVVEVGA